MSTTGSTGTETKNEKVTRGLPDGGEGEGSGGADGEKIPTLGGAININKNPSMVIGLNYYLFSRSPPARLRFHLRSARVATSDHTRESKFFAMLEGDLHRFGEQFDRR